VRGKRLIPGVLCGTAENQSWARAGFVHGKLGFKKTGPDAFGSLHQADKQIRGRRWNKEPKEKRILFRKKETVGQGGEEQKYIRD